MPRIRGAKEAAARIRALGGTDMERVVTKALYTAGSLIETDMAHSITEGSVSGKNHFASLPGQPPNADTGVLDRSIETVVVDRLQVEVSVNAPYAAALEYGTSKMAPRPYAAPAIARNRKKVAEHVARAVQSLNRKG